jgi:gamma-glutamyltranspeptidase/glutathione hydrolase
MRNLELPGRSPVHARNGIAATSHPVSTFTALSILQAGGNAMDAAVAACAVQGVVEPESTGIGGDCFVLYAPGGSGDVIAYNGSGRAPAAATPEWYADQGITEIEQTMPHAVTIPGSIDAWDRLIRDHGSMSLGELLQPAIDYARDGYAITPRVSYDWHMTVDMLRDDPNAARIFLPEGRAPKVGEMHSQPELAMTLAKIAENGRDAFYTGEVAADMVEYLQSLGGLHTMEDFATAAGEYVTPIRTDFRGYEVLECPPNGQGITALIMLNILSRFDPAGVDPLSVERLHIEVEAGRLAYADRDAYIADPDQVEVPVDKILSVQHSEDLRNQIDPARAMDPLEPAPLPNHEDTVYITVVDKDRNAVSFINSIYHNFGSSRVSPKFGVLMQNRGEAFSLDPAHPNCIAPGKRPMHTIIPAMLLKDGRAQMPFGVMGGTYQAFGHAHFLTRVLDFGFDLQEALDLPRMFPEPGGNLELESGFAPEISEGLAKMGHKVSKPKKPIGGAQAIWIDWENGTLCGASEPRKDGCAIGY